MTKTTTWMKVAHECPEFSNIVIYPGCPEMRLCKCIVPLVRAKENTSRPIEPEIDF